MPICSEVMTPEPACCEPKESITGVASQMKKEGVGAVPVVESLQSRRLVGIVTDRDIVIKVVADGRDVSSATVRDAMTPDPGSVRDTDDVDRALRLMAERQVRRMPVVDASGRLVGIIAQADIATRVNRDKATGELVEAISEPGAGRR